MIPPLHPIASAVHRQVRRRLVRVLLRHGWRWTVVLTCSALPGAWAQTLPNSGVLLNEQPRPEPGAPPPGGANVLPRPVPQPAPEPAAPGATFVLHHITLTGNDTLPSSLLLPLVSDRIGQTVSMEDLNGLAARIEDAYHVRGYVLAQVVIPPQDAPNGDISLTIVEGRIGHVYVNVAADAPIREKQVRDRLAAIRPGVPLQQADLERAMLLLSDLPGIKVTSSLEAGGEPGTVDMTVNVDKGQRVQISATLDNYGAPEAGAWRLGVNGRIASPFGIGDVADFVLLGAQRGDTYLAHGGYEAPLGDARIGIAYSHLYYYLGQEFSSLQAHGDADVVSTSISYPLVRSRSQNLLLRGGLEFRSLDDRVDAADLDDRAKLYAASAGLSYESRDAFLNGGFNSASLQVMLARLHIDSPLDEALDQGPDGRHTEGDSVRLTMQANRLNTITERTSVYIGVTGQWASRNLDSSSRIALGGPSAVRAYSPAEAVVDNALIGTVSFRYAVQTWCTVSAFFDAAKGWYNASPIAGQGNNSITRNGVGLELFLTGPEKITVDATLAWRTSGADTTGNDKVPRFYVQLSKAF